MAALLTMAKDKDGVLVEVDSVEKGLKCGCTCPHCDAPLYAKNGGLIRDHHFAHAKGMECENAYETALHMLAKEVLKEAKCVMLPSGYSGNYPTGLVHLENVMTEHPDETWGFVPDAEGTMENGERLLIEILVSHKVDPKKRKIILDNKLKCIEIDVNSVELHREKMRQFLLGTDEDRKWIGEIEEKNEDGEGSAYIRNPRYAALRDRIKDLFDEGLLKIAPKPKYSYDPITGITTMDGYHDLKTLGYDGCLVGRRYRGLKTDLLLFRSKKEGDERGYIAICIRGRKRSYGFSYPSGLRVIDIILRVDLPIKNLFQDGYLYKEYWGLEIEYINFK